VAILGDQSNGFWKDHKGAGVNAIRTQTLIRQADMVVVRFGDKYNQWNAAFDAGFAAALGKPIVTLHLEEHNHAQKEIDRAAMATAEPPTRSLTYSATCSTGSFRRRNRALLAHRREIGSP
jgi:YtoQ family protein